MRPSQMVSAVVPDMFYFLQWFSETSHSRSFLSSSVCQLGVETQVTLELMCEEWQHLCQPESLNDSMEPNTPFTTPTATNEVHPHRTFYEQEINVYDVKLLRFGGASTKATSVTLSP